jgi:putative nucleotidyltransferase with HDIG domain
MNFHVCHTRRRASLKFCRGVTDKSLYILMQPLSSVDSESAARGRRVAELSKQLAARLRSSTENVFEVCDAFDEAVEFAALEGMSVAEAIAAFVEEGAAVGWAVECAELARLAGYGSAGIDIAAMSLPVMPKQAGRLLRTTNEDTSVAELERIAASDPVLAGKLLGAANSAQAGSEYRVFRLWDAIMRLGIPEARRVLLASCVGGLFASKPLQDLWQHSQTVAQAAYDLASLAGNVDGELAYVAGLLHDIGRLGFVKLPPERAIREQKWVAAGFPVVYAETLAYGIDHAALGAQLLRAWELPGGIVDAVSLHHRPERSESELSALLSLAEDLNAHTASEDLWPDMRRTAACLTARVTVAQIEEFSLGNPSLQRLSA